MSRGVDLNDTQLVEMAKAGEQAAFDILVKRFQRAVYAVAFAVLSDREAAQDIMQESFIAAYRQIHTVTEPTKFGAWVCGIARNQSKQLLRNLSRIHFCEVSYSDMEPFSDQTSVNERIDLIRDALSVLTDVQADVVTLFYMESYSIEECAKILSVPNGTVKRRLHDARQRLKKEMVDMVAKHLKEYSLPEDYRVVIDKPSRIPSTHPTIAWFKDRWVLIWQDGIVWGKERWAADRFEFWMSESVDGIEWSEPRRIDLGEAHYLDAFNFHLKQILVHNGRLYIQTYMHDSGIDIYSSADLIDWMAHPRVRIPRMGRAGVFSGNGELFISYPAWISPGSSQSDRIDMIKSSDGGNTWQWLTSPCWPELGITDSAGLMVGDRLYVIWRGHALQSLAGENNVYICWSDDGGLSWSKPVLVEPLLIPSPFGSLSLQLIMANKKLVIVQEVCNEDQFSTGEVWFAMSADGGKTWTEKATYSSGGLLDPAIGFALDGSFLMVGSSHTGDEARPWVVHSRIL